MLSSDIIDLVLADAASRQLRLQPPRLIRLHARDWPNSALGLPESGYMYAQVITPGYLAEILVGGTIYTYHTDLHDRFKLAGYRPFAETTYSAT